MRVIQLEPFDDGEHEAATAKRMAELRADQEARRRLDAEREHVEGLDDLYLDRAALDSLPAPDPLIPGVLPRHAYGVLRGRDQSFKSFVALDWALTLATGSWWQLAPVERVPVLYIAGEGAWGLRARVAAWEERHQVKVEPGCFTVRQAALNMHRPGPAFDHLLEHVEAGGYGLVVVDTLRRVSGAADGNGSEMGLVVDSLDRIKQATADGTVLVVAHTDKGDNDSRGYSGIEDDADFVWHVRREQMRVELELTKMKDGPDGHTLQLQAWPVLDSLVLSQSTARPEHDEATESEAKLIATLQSVFPDGAFGAALRDASGLARPTYYRALAGLQKRRLVTKSGSHQRPFIEAVSLTANLTGSVGVSPPDSPSDLGSLKPVSDQSHGVSPVSRPLGSETPETPRLRPPLLGGPTQEQKVLLEQIERADQ